MKRRVYQFFRFTLTRANQAIQFTKRKFQQKMAETEQVNQMLLSACQNSNQSTFNF